MRPLFVDFPHDAPAWDVEDAYMFGNDILVAPVLTPGSRERAVYLPIGHVWMDAWTGAVHEGGRVVNALAPLERCPVFLRDPDLLPLFRDAS
jgi:alpha-D-xyloside xylohydrolase